MNENTQEQQSFKESLKATSLFGGVQFYNILIGVVRTKFVAFLLGPTGMGVYGLYDSAVNLINAVTSLGLGTSAVRNISVANESGNQSRIEIVVSVFRRIVWFTGLFALFACLVLSPLLSKVTFGDSNHTIGFILLSCTLLFKQLTTCQNALLQGMHRYKFMAKANVIGSTIGLFVTVPLYYLWGIDAIVPVMIITNLTSLVIAYFYSRKVKVKTVPVTKTIIREVGRNMVVMGVMISLSSIFTIAASYIVRVFIGHTGSVDDVGLYNAGFAIVNTYVGLIFTAMATDYYPRLSAANDNLEKFNMVLNNQLEISLLVLGPVIAAFIIFAQPVVIILYSEEFLSIEAMLYLAMFGIFFKTVSNLVAFSFLAKADSMFYFWNELSAIIYTTAFNIFCYKMWGLTGMGISFLISYLIYAVQVWFICSRRFKISISKSVWSVLVKQMPVSLVCILIVILLPGIYKYLVGSLFLFLSGYMAYKDLNKKIDIMGFVMSKIRR